MPSQEANGHNLGMHLFAIRSSINNTLSTQQNRLLEAIRMSTHNIHFHDKLRKFP